MLVYNKYLKELGYEKSDFPFRTKDGRFKLDKEFGVVEAQTWNLYNTIVLELYTYLRYFQDECPKGIPGPFIDDSKDDHGLSDWRAVLAKIVDGLKAYWLAQNLDPLDAQKEYVDWQKERDKLYEQFEEAWKLLGDNIDCLWW